VLWPPSIGGVAFPERRGGTGDNMQQFSNINWPSTLKVALARGVASGIVISVGILVLASHVDYSGAWMMLVWPFFAVTTALIMHGVIKFVGAIFRTAAGPDNAVFELIISGSLFVASLLVACGDPLVYWLNREQPTLLGVADFKVFNFFPLMLVYDNR
jgi:hypothetical protein